MEQEVTAEERQRQDQEQQEQQRQEEQRRQEEQQRQEQQDQLDQLEIQDQQLQQQLQNQQQADESQDVDMTEDERVRQALDAFNSSQNPQEDIVQVPREQSPTIEEQAERAAQLALAGFEDAEVSSQNIESQPLYNAQPEAESSAHQQPHDQSQQQQPQLQDAAALGYADTPYPTAQSAPTQVLYEQARLAATIKSSPSNRRAGLPSQRRPWSTEEENALMAGLDRVKGPHWSQILAMFGPGGTVNEALKDRNQVQLKDKARNLKLFFLKSGVEVPYYLQFVTGELKTRAPGQAAKHEARERLKARSEEDRAHIDGIGALAGIISGNASVGHSNEGVYVSPYAQEVQMSRGSSGQGAVVDQEEEEIPEARELTYEEQFKAQISKALKEAQEGLDEQETGQNDPQQALEQGSGNENGMSNANIGVQTTGEETEILSTNGQEGENGA
jgi:protein TBF1